MSALKDAIGAIYDAPVQQMSFPAYFAYINTAGKVTARSLMETQAVILTFLDVQERKNAQYEADFKQIEEILALLTEKEPPNPNGIMAPLDVYMCTECGKVCKTDFGLKGHLTSHKVPKV